MWLQFYVIYLQIYFGGFSFLLSRVKGKGCRSLLSPIMLIVICEYGLDKYNLIDELIDLLKIATVRRICRYPAEAGKRSFNLELGTQYITGNVSVVAPLPRPIIFEL